MQVIYDDLTACVDCLFYLANGEVTDGNGEDIADTHAAKIAVQWPDPEHRKHMVLSCSDSPDGCLHAEDSPCAEFSWRRCDICGSNLGGEKHRAAILGD